MTMLAEPTSKTRENPLATRADLVETMMALRKGLNANRQLPDRLVELMRLRVAFRNQCRPCMSRRYADALDDGLTEDLVCSLERPEDAPDLTPAEKAAVAYADQFAIDHLAIDTQLAGLFRHFTPQQIAEIAMNAAFFVGFGRMSAVFDDGAEQPVGARRPDGGLLAPWKMQGQSERVEPA
jgi:AhpD family alkylhydroperoxidase